MFGGQPQENNRTPPPQPAARDVARIQGGGLVHLILTRLDPLAFYLFLNDQVVEQQDVESFLVSIEVPEDGNLQGGTVSATLGRYVKSVSGERTVQQSELFPCTVEVIAAGRRIAVTCMNPGSLEGAWISLGLKRDGSGSEITGAKALRILLTEGILDAKLTWTDGTTEDLLLD